MYSFLGIDKSEFFYFPECVLIYVRISKINDYLICYGYSSRYGIKIGTVYKYGSVFTIYIIWEPDIQMFIIANFQNRFISL